MVMCGDDVNINENTTGALGGERWAAQDDSPEECPIKLAFDFVLAHTTRALGEDATGVSDDNTTGAWGEDATGAWGGGAVGALREDATGACDDSMTGAWGEDATDALGGDAIGALREEATGASGGDFVLDNTTRVSDDKIREFGSLRDHLSRPSHRHTGRVSSRPLTALSIMVRPN